MLAHAAIMAGLAPQLRPLWVAQRAAEALGRAGLDPRDGAIPAPVAVAGFDEPSLDYALGGQAEDGTAEEAAQAVRGGRAAILASDQEQAFLKALGADRPRARRAASVDGFDYVKGAPVRLLVYAPLAARSHPGGWD
jgi:hypothetical protein